MKYWLAIVIGSGLSVAVLWLTAVPLGIPGEWTWERASFESDSLWNLCGGTVAAALYISFVRLGWYRLRVTATKRWRRLKMSVWLVLLVIVGFMWLWIIQEISPARNRLGKSPFVLYYPGSSGYFTRARYDEPSAVHLLAGYEELMSQGDVLHTGTHPPGLFLAFHAMIAACESSKALSTFLDQSQPPSIREACELIASNARRTTNPRQVLPLDTRVLWLATLIVMLSASLTVIPLFGLIRQTCSVETAWLGASIWPALPAVAIFIPKSDVVFPLVCVTILWLWITAWKNRSLIAALLAGLVTWIGLVCSLAFLPVILLGFLLTIGVSVVDWIQSRLKSSQVATVHANRIEHHQQRYVILCGLCLTFAGIGFAIPTYLTWRYAGCNLIHVWLMNYRNHSGFYSLYARTYWKWLLINPIELSFAAGWPIALTAFVALISYLRCLRTHSDDANFMRCHVIRAIAFVWGFLWLSGKNSGEAARLWILLFPLLIWMACLWLDEMARKIPSVKNRERFSLSLLSVQFAVCLLTVVRVSGFHSEATETNKQAQFPLHGRPVAIRESNIPIDKLLKNS